VRIRSFALAAVLILALSVGVGALVVGTAKISPPPRLDFGVSIAVGPNGTVYVADRADSTVLAVENQKLRLAFTDPTAGALTTIAIDAQGRLIFADGTQRVVREDGHGGRTTLIDNLAEVRDIDVTPGGSVYVVGGLPARVVRIAPDGSRSEVVGEVDSTGAAPRTGVSEAALDADGSVLVLSEWRLWRIATGVQPALVAGSLHPENEVGNGDGGPADHALLNDPYALAVTTAGYFFCDESRRHLRRVDRSGAISTVMSLALGHGCVDIAAVPGTPDLVVLDEDGMVMRVSGDGQTRRVLLPRASTQ
jgi:hypothetical protein